MEKKYARRDYRASKADFGWDMVPAHPPTSDGCEQTGTHENCCSVGHEARYTNKPIYSAALYPDSVPVEMMSQPIIQTRLTLQDIPKMREVDFLPADRRFDIGDDIRAKMQQAIAEQEPGNKATNPKDAIGSKKVPIMSVVPWGVIGRIALGLLEGAIKYGRHNYRIYGVRASVYVDATLRHVARFWEGEDLDPDSKVGLHHIDKALASLTVLRDAMLQENWHDDRPPRSEDGWVDSLNDQAAELIATLGPAKPPYTEKK